MDLSLLEDFNLVATHDGFGKASRASGRPKATLSRRVMGLEQSLGVRLFERGARSLRLTEEGRALYERTRGLLAEIVEAGSDVAAGISEPRGQLRISAPVLFAQARLGPLAAGFIKAYPGVRLDITAEDRRVDLIEDGYDAVIRVNPRPDATLVGRCFARDQVVLVAPSSFAAPGRQADQPATVPAVALDGRVDARPWRYHDGQGLRTVTPDVRLTLSSLVMIRDAVIAGAGAALIPRFLLDQSVPGPGHGHGLSVWGTVPDRPVELWVLHHSRRLASIKVTRFVEYLCDAFPSRTLHG